MHTSRNNTDKQWLNCRTVATGRIGWRMVMRIGISIPHHLTVTTGYLSSELLRYREVLHH